MTRGLPAPVAATLVAPVASTSAINLSTHQWTDIVKFLTAEELKALRLAGSKSIDLSNPMLTCHLQLRMDLAAFFSIDNPVFSLSDATKWLTNRRRLVINDPNSNICPRRVEYLVKNQFMDSISEIVIFDCHIHRTLFSILARLPNLDSVRLASHASDQNVGVLEELEFLVADIKNVRKIKQLDIEFDRIVHGGRLCILRDLRGLRKLRLRGFDLSSGISYIRDLTNLTSLHLCHGNFYTSPSADVNEEDFSYLASLSQLKDIHIEGFGDLSGLGLKSFATTPSSQVNRLIMKHCEFFSEECLTFIGRMGSLISLHLVHSAYDEVPVLDHETRQRLNALVSLKSLSLFYMLESVSDLKDFSGLSTLETLNLAFEDELDDEDIDYLCETILATFVSLKKLRIFSEDGMAYSSNIGTLKVEHAPFNFGDIVQLE